MQIDETVHGCPVVAVVHLIVRLEILAFQVKSGPPRDSRLWLRPAGRAMNKKGLSNGSVRFSASLPEILIMEEGVRHDTLWFWCTLARDLRG